VRVLRGECRAPERWFRWCVRRLPWRQEDARVFGRVHPLPRLTAFLAPPGSTYRYSGVTHEGAGLGRALSVLTAAVGAAVAGDPGAFDSVLASLYRDGRDRIGWHADDEAALGPEPALAILSLGAPRTLRFRPRTGGPSSGVELRAGDLLYMAPGVQAAWQHALPARRDAGMRVSLGFRRLATEEGAP
jgi:alkylated DNA repair dioxygenase AlkB